MTAPRLPDGLQAAQSRLDGLSAGVQRWYKSLLAIASGRLGNVLIGLFTKLFPRPKLPNEEKNQAATVLADYFGIAILYHTTDFLIHFKTWTALGVTNVTLFIGMMFVMRYHAMAGRLKFVATLYVFSVTYFYLIVVAEAQYFEHLQASNFLSVVAFVTLTVGPVAGAVALAASLFLFWLLLKASELMLLTPLYSILGDSVMSPFQEWRMISFNLVETFLFCWLVHAHIFGQLRKSIVREKAVAVKEVAARETADRAERQKSQYLVHVNHELRNPLTAILTSVEMLSKDYAAALETGSPSVSGLGPRAGQCMSTIRKTSEHVLSILNDVLEMERLEGDDSLASTESFSVRKLVQDVSEIYSTSASDASSNISTRVAVGMSDDWVGPVSRIRQVLLNLVSNAVKHAPGSSIVISASQSAHGLVFEVSDDGPGLSQHAREHLFQPFASSLGASGSTGLGLRICKLIIERQLRGSIEAKSEPGMGTSFTVSVPLRPDESTTQAHQKWEYVDRPSSPSLPVGPKIDEAPEATTSVLSGKSLLLIDDDADNLIIITMALQGVGMSVKTAQTSQEAIEILTAAEFDFTLLDHNLGPKSELNGIELATKIVGGRAGPVVGYTGNYSDEVDRVWSAAGVMGIVRKPASIKTLTAALVAAATV